MLFQDPVYTGSLWFLVLNLIIYFKKLSSVSIEYFSNLNNLYILQLLEFSTVSYHSFKNISLSFWWTEQVIHLELRKKCVDHTFCIPHEYSMFLMFISHLNVVARTFVILKLYTCNNKVYMSVDSFLSADVINFDQYEHLFLHIPWHLVSNSSFLKYIWGTSIELYWFHQGFRSPKFRNHITK